MLPLSAEFSGTIVYRIAEQAKWPASGRDLGSSRGGARTPENN